MSLKKINFILIALTVNNIFVKEANCRLVFFLFKKWIKLEADWNVNKLIYRC